MPNHTLLLGLGNPLLGDDGVGWKVVEKVKGYAPDHTEFDFLSVGGLALMERLIGYDRAILVDSIQTGSPVGTVVCLPLEDLPNPSAGHTTSAHDTSLQTALKLGASLGVKLPPTVFVIGIQAQKVYDFSEELTPPVAGAIPEAVQLILNILHSKEAQP